jgi:hypothetical protein
MMKHQYKLHSFLFAMVEAGDDDDTLIICVLDFYPFEVHWKHLHEAGDVDHSEREFLQLFIEPLEYQSCISCC